MDPFDLKEIRRLVKASPEIDRAFITKQQSAFAVAKRELIGEFDAHPITQELQGGVDAPNLSNTLGGNGNLFTFIGFPARSEPTEIIRRLLQTQLLLRNPIKRDTADGFQYVFPISLPTEEIISATPLPFESGNSWVAGVESGISGFSNFIYRASEASRSGKGIESKNIVNPGVFQPKPYVLTMLNNFSTRLIALGTFSS